MTSPALAASGSPVLMVTVTDVRLAVLTMTVAVAVLTLLTSSGPASLTSLYSTCFKKGILTSHYQRKARQCALMTTNQWLWHLYLAYPISPNDIKANIIEDRHHPGHPLIWLLSSGRWYRILVSRIDYFRHPLASWTTRLNLSDVALPSNICFQASFVGYALAPLK